MFRSLLVPLDGSPFSEQALPLAELVGRSSDAQLNLVLVEQSGLGHAGREQYLSGIAARLAEDGLSVDHGIVDGKVVDAIVARAEEIQADLIVMATHGRSGFERLRLGSVAEGLVTEGVAPMLLLHREGDAGDWTPNRVEHILVALDHSSLAQSIVDPVERLGRVVGAERYTIVHVAESKGSAGKAGWTPLATVQSRTQEKLAPIQERLGRNGGVVDLQIVVAANPGEGILGVAKTVGADLVAMATHGMTGLRPSLVGSVAARVVRGWDGPLLIQRPSES